MARKPRKEVQAAPISNISELNHLGQTTSITLPKKTNWKVIVASAAALLTAGGIGYYLAASEVLRSTSGAPEQIADTPLEEGVPIAPNPSVMPPNIDASGNKSEVTLVKPHVKPKKAVTKSISRTNKSKALGKAKGKKAKLSEKMAIKR